MAAMAPLDREPEEAEEGEEGVESSTIKPIL